MRFKQLCCVFALLLVLVAVGVESNCDESTSHSMPGYIVKQSRVGTGVISAAFIEESLEGGDEESNEADASNSGSSSNAITFPTATTAIPSTLSPVTEQPASPAATEPVVDIESDSASSSQSDDSSASVSGTAQSTSVPRIVTSPSSAFSDSGGSDSASTSSGSGSAGPTASDTNSDGEASIAQPGSDSSTFQSVPTAVCSEEEVDNVYTLYSNCRSAFDLCVSASNYHIFPYQGKHPTQAQIQGMTESDACVAVFIVVIEANFSACTIGGMPLVSAVETLLKISVDLEQGNEDEAPTADEFQELLAWRYAVDLAKDAGVPYDGNSDLYHEFETNLNVALTNTSIRVNEDLSVDVRLANGTYEAFEDAIDLVVTDASASDLVPGYVIASSAESSGSTAGIISESSDDVTGCIPTLWNVAVVVVISVLLLDRRRI
ncbi:hypothetical protein P3T76_015788 [Phytophthora citrophthora]|uniref:Elicitin n=1 Tax=Phytophthora citrophthora TaxID=4793 RepID=A0AAD9L9X9_9STRA|nr:hypothetical protein P3T76_015788 [Phytophthora citrophthora]